MAEEQATLENVDLFKGTDSKDLFDEVPENKGDKDGEEQNNKDGGSGETEGEEGKKIIVEGEKNEIPEIIEEEKVGKGGKEEVSKKDNGKTEEEENERKFKIEGVDYTEDELKVILADTEKNKDWRKENTLKSQEVKESRRKNQAINEFAEVLQNASEEKVKSIRDYVESDFSAEDLKKFDAILDSKNITPHPDTIKLEEQEVEIAKSKENQQEKDDRIFLKEEYHLKPAEIDKVYKYANDKVDESGELINVVTAYHDMVYKGLIEEIKELKKKKKDEIPDTVSKRKSAPDTKLPRVKSIEEIDTSDWDIFEKK